LLRNYLAGKKTAVALTATAVFPFLVITPGDTKKIIFGQVPTPYFCMNALASALMMYLNRSIPSCERVQCDLISAFPSGRAQPGWWPLGGKHFK
jgi:hypothetical protein